MTPVTLPATVHPDDPEYTRERYSVTQAAAYLNRSTDLVYAEASAKRLGHRRDGTRRLFFSQWDLDLWRAARRCEQKGAPADSQLIGRVTRPRQAAQDLRLPAVRRFGVTR